MIAYDHQIVIEGIEHMLQEEPRIRVVSTARHGGEVLSYLLKDRADQRSS